MKTTNEKIGAHIYEKELPMLTYQLVGGAGKLWRRPDEVMKTIITPEGIRYRMIRFWQQTII